MKTNQTLLKVLNPEIRSVSQNETETSFISKSPLRSDAFLMTDEEKIRIISSHFNKIMHTLGLDLNDDSLKNTPDRVAKMYVKEVFGGLNPANKPNISLFSNDYQYNEMLVEKNITLYSYCEHHFAPIIGKAHIAYFPNGQVIGLSKLARIVQYYSRRPQVQERLTNQIAQALKDALQSEDVAVIIDAEHLCVSSRGIKDTKTSTVTSNYSGKFKNSNTKIELMTLINGTMK